MLSKLSSLCRNAGVRKKLANAETSHQVIDVLWNESTAKGLGISRRAITAFMNDLNQVKKPADLHLDSLMYLRWSPGDTGIRQPCGGTQNSCDTKRINQPGC